MGKQSGQELSHVPVGEERSVEQLVITGEKVWTTTRPAYVGSHTKESPGFIDWEMVPGQGYIRWSGMGQDATDTAIWLLVWATRLSWAKHEELCGVSIVSNAGVGTHGHIKT